MALVAPTSVPLTDLRFSNSIDANSLRNSQSKVQFPQPQPPAQPRASVSLKTSQSNNQHALQRAQARIASLEKTIDFIQDQHKASLQGLHAEIARLQNVCAGKLLIEIKRLYFP
jgi:hypothetical protein